MSFVCAFCGKVVAQDRLNCPHCGADADLTYVEEGHQPELDLDTGEMDEPGYEAFLRREGLAPGRPRAPRLPALWILLAAALAGLLYAVL